MARKIGVIEAHQSDSRFCRDVTKSVARLLIRRLLADWIVVNQVIRMRPISALPAQIPPALFLAPSAKPYIPEHLPWAELPGLIFRPPASAQRNFVSCSFPLARLAEAVPQ
jgi:hypothetical protein